MTDVPNRVSWVNLAVGILTIIAPFALGDTSVATRWGLVIGGLVIAIVAIIELSLNAQHHNRGSYWPVVNIVAGVWLLVATSLAAGNAGVVWSDTALGIVTIVTAIVSLAYDHMSATAGMMDR